VRRMAALGGTTMQQPSSPSVGLQTSGRELRQMLEKSGARHKLEGAEKLDFLMWLADQVKGSVEEGRRMQLKCSELTEFLRRERVAAAGSTLDAKGAVSGLLELRRRELSRLNYDSAGVQDMECGDAHFMLALAKMPQERVDSCFDDALVLYEAAETLPGQVQSPRQEPAAARQSPLSGVSLRQSAQAGSPMSGQDPHEAPEAVGRSAEARTSFTPKSRGSFSSPVSRGSSAHQVMPPGVPPPPRMAPPPVRAASYPGTSPAPPTSSEPPSVESKSRCEVM